jgi:hypothetical protein
MRITLQSENLKTREKLRYLDVNGMIILKCVSNKQEGKVVWLDSCGQDRDQWLGLLYTVVMM